MRNVGTKEALQFKKEQGMKLGRPKGVGKSKLDAFKPEIESLLANGSTQKFGWCYTSNAALDKL